MQPAICQIAVNSRIATQCTARNDRAPCAALQHGWESYRRMADKGLPARSASKWVLRTHSLARRACILVSYQLPLALEIGRPLHVDEVRILGRCDFVATPKVRVADQRIRPWTEAVF